MGWKFSQKIIKLKPPIGKRLSSVRRFKMMHSVYQKILSEYLEKWQKRRSRSLKEEWLEAALLLFRLDLDSVSEDLKKLYSPNPRGRPPYEPVCMLRALLLMTILRFTAISQFALEL